MICLAANYAAYEAEIHRAGLMAVDKGQREAALSIGMSEKQAFFIVTLPQALARLNSSLAKLEWALLPGDVVRFDAGAVSVNGAPFDVKVVSEGADADSAPEDRGQWLLRETAAGESRTIKVNPFVMGREPPSGMGDRCAIASDTAWQCTVPAGQYLMMGDNRDNSADSRAWGFLPHAQVYGKAVRVLFNLHDLSRAWTAL